MKVRLLVLAMAMPLLLAAQDKPAELKEFTSKDGGFSIMLPGTPKEDVRKSKGPDGKETANHLFVVDLKTTA